MTVYFNVIIILVLSRVNSHSNATQPAAAAEGAWNAMMSCELDLVHVTVCSSL